MNERQRKRVSSAVDDGNGVKWVLTSPIPSLGDFERSGDVEMNREAMRTVGVRGEARAMSLVERSIAECCISMWSVERLIEVKKEVAEERKSIELLSIAYIIEAKFR